MRPSQGSLGFYVVAYASAPPAPTEKRGGEGGHSWIAPSAALASRLHLPLELGTSRPSGEGGEGEEEEGKEEAEAEEEAEEEVEDPSIPYDPPTATDMAYETATAAGPYPNPTPTPNGEEAAGATGVSSEVGSDAEEGWHCPSSEEDEVGPTLPP